MVVAVRYYDSAGNIHVQPAKTFVNTLWGFNIIRLMLLSGIGNPYNPTSITGSLGRAAVQPNGAPSRTATGTACWGSRR